MRKQQCECAAATEKLVHVKWAINLNPHHLVSQILDFKADLRQITDLMSQDFTVLLICGLTVLMLLLG